MIELCTYMCKTNTKTTNDGHTILHDSASMQALGEFDIIPLWPGHSHHPLVHTIMFLVNLTLLLHSPTSHAGGGGGVALLHLPPTGQMGWGQIGLAPPPNGWWAPPPGGWEVEHGYFLVGNN